jgi:hypothetical protein
MSNLKKFLFRRCRRFFPNFSVIGLPVRELHLPEVEGVIMKFMEDFHDKASGILFQMIVPFKSTVEFVLNFKQFLFRRCRRFFSNFNIIDLAVKELHLPEVEGVEIVYFFLNLSKVIFSPKA